MPKEVEQRITAIRAARHCYQQGMSIQAFENAVYDSIFADDEVNDALWALKDRGELEHLAYFVWTFRK